MSPHDQVQLPNFFYSGRPWDVSASQYETLLEESDYGAWMAAIGYRPNHFTVFVNHLKKYSDLETLNDFLKAKGFKLNTSGGEIKGTPQVFLEQSSTLANSVEVEFTDGERKSQVAISNLPNAIHWLRVSFITALLPSPPTKFLSRRMPQTSLTNPRNITEMESPSRVKQITKMNIRCLIRRLANLVMLSVAITSLPAVTAEKSPPNIVIVVLDDAGFSDYSFLGSRIQTRPSMH